MEKLKFSYKDLGPKVKVYLDDSLIMLDKPIHICDDLSIPRRFKYYNYLANLKKSIEDIKKETKSLIEWIEDSNIKLDRTISDIISDVKSLDEIEIKKI